MNVGVTRFPVRAEHYEITGPEDRPDGWVLTRLSDGFPVLNDVTWSNALMCLKELETLCGWEPSAPPVVPCVCGNGLVERDGPGWRHRTGICLLAGVGMDLCRPNFEAAELPAARR